MTSWVAPTEQFTLDYLPDCTEVFTSIEAPLYEDYLPAVIVSEYNRGHISYALKLRSFYLRCGDHAPEEYGFVGPKDALSLSERVWFLALQHYRNELTSPTVSRPSVLLNLDKLMRAHPATRTDYTTSLRASLLATIGSKPAAVGSIEGEIDRLVNERMPSTRNLLQGPRKDSSNYNKLARRGFEAVPTLISHFGDPRLTGNYTVYGQQYDRLDTVGDTCQSLVDGMSGKWNLSQEEALEWFRSVSGLDPVKYAVTDQKTSERESVAMMALIQAKSPASLQEILVSRVSSPNPLWIGETVSALLGSTLPRSEKLAALKTAYSKSSEVKRKQLLYTVKTMNAEIAEQMVGVHVK